MPKRNAKPDQPLERETGTPPYPGRLPPLRDRRQCARYVATLIRAGHRGQMPLDQVRTLVYSAQVLAGLLDDTDARMEAIEGALATLVSVLGSGGTITVEHERLQRLLPTAIAERLG
jgi:hypothetical protein